jgi:hypothetical protein
VVAPVSRPDAVATSVPPVSDSVNEQVETLRRKIAERAAIDFPDDFRSGFLNWDGVDDWGRSWSHDVVLGVRPSKLALFKPSIPLRDYSFEFMAQMEKRAISFVVRATDLKNYYVVKLVQVGAGPLPPMRVVRYAVRDGYAEKPKSTPLPLVVTKDTVYRINLDVKSDLFTLYVNGKVADVWTDGRFESGGVGFFSGREEAARIYSIRVSHQTDTVGRAAAYISKPNATR